MTVPHPWHMPRASVFVAVHEAGSISAAARQLGLTKSVVSNHLKQLEEVCGARLLERTTRQLRLTDAGAQLLPYARQMLASWSEGLEALRASMEAPTGRLTIAAPSLLAQLVLPEAMATFRRRYPEVGLDLRLSDDLTDLIAEKVDVALRAGPLPSSELIVKKIAEDVHVLVCAPALLAERPLPPHPDGLADWPWVVHTSRKTRFDLSGPRGACCCLEVEAPTRVDSATGLAGLAQAGLGVALVPSMLARPGVESGHLVRILPGWSGATVPIFAVYPSRDFLAPKVARFVEILQDEMPDVVG